MTSLDSNTLQDLANIIILSASFLGAITAIYTFFAKPTSYFKAKFNNKKEADLKKMLDKLLPVIFSEHDSNFEEKREEKLQKEIPKIVQETYQGIILEIRKANADQNVILERLVSGMRNVLRSEIMEIFHNNLQDEQLTISEKDMLQSFYSDYKSLNGNSYIDTYYGVMKKWNVVPDKDKQRNKQ